jgi:hypothetical protein
MDGYEPDREPQQAGNDDPERWQMEQRSGAHAAPAMSSSDAGGIGRPTSRRVRSASPVREPMHSAGCPRSR